MATLTLCLLVLVYMCCDEAAADAEGNTDTDPECDNPIEIDFGSWYQNIEISTGHWQAKYECDDGYKRRGPNAINCVIGVGTWGGSQNGQGEKPRCQACNPNQPVSMCVDDPDDGSEPEEPTVVLPSKLINDCKDWCSNYLVTGPHGVPDKMLTASSNFPGDDVIKIHSNLPQRSRVNEVAYVDAEFGFHRGGWAPAVDDALQWIQVEFKRISFVRGVLTRGRNGCIPVSISVNGCSHWVETYEIKYSCDCTTWKSTEETYVGNDDKESPVMHMFDLPFYARCVRIRPITWHLQIYMRFELIGCESPSSFVFW